MNRAAIRKLDRALLDVGFLYLELGVNSFVVLTASPAATTETAADSANRCAARSTFGLCRKSRPPS
jgi:hypothetical protein